MTIVKSIKGTDVNKYKEWFENFAISNDVDWSTFFGDSENSIFLDLFRSNFFQCTLRTSIIGLELKDGTSLLHRFLK